MDRPDDLHNTVDDTQCQQGYDKANRRGRLIPGDVVIHYSLSGSRKQYCSQRSQCRCDHDHHQTAFQSPYPLHGKTQGTWFFPAFFKGLIRYKCHGDPGITLFKNLHGIADSSSSRIIYINIVSADPRKYDKVVIIPMNDARKWLFLFKTVYTDGKPFGFHPILTRRLEYIG